MPAKKRSKAAKKPAKPAPRKAASKAAAPKKATHPRAKPLPKPAASKVNVKAKKKSAIRPNAENGPHPEPPKAPVARPPMPMPRPTGDEDAEYEAQPMSLLAGPRNVKPYIPRRGEQYMSTEQLEHFAQILQNWKRDLMVEVDRTVLHMKDEAANFPDPNDRATQEEEFSLELRTRDRERKLIRKIDEALKRIEDGTYGYCLETGEEIGIKRLEARPVATLSVEAQERRERREKQYGDRDDRYR